MAQVNNRPPRDNLYRVQALGFELRDDEDGSPILTGHFAVFNEWTEIDSWFEGRFMERIAPGAFKKNFDENRDRIKVLFQHGRDAQMGSKVLGPIDELREDDVGAYYEVSLLDGIPPLLLNGLRKDLYGASFRFRVIREEIDQKPKKSAHNPEGIPERTIKEIETDEFGPVTFPAYVTATAGIRSLTDEFVVERFIHDPDHLAEVIKFARDGIHGTSADDTSSETKDRNAPPPSDAGNGHLRKGRRVSVDAFLERRANVS